MNDFDYYYDLFQDVLDFYEFDLSVDEENNWRVIDRQGGNIGGIEQDTFETLAQIVDRMDIYHNDYIIRSLEEVFPEIEYSSWEDLYNQLIKLSQNEDLSDFEFDIKVLEMLINSEPVLSNKEENEKLKKIWRDKNE